MENGFENILIFGAGGAIGGALRSHLSDLNPQAHITAISRRDIDYEDETSLSYLAETLSEERPFDCVIVAIGLLHGPDFGPEKSLRDLNAQNLQRVFEVNCVIPAMIMKYILPKLSRQKRAVFAALSARVGSISDNRLGGWYGYRASKAALNQMIKTAAIEMARKNKEAIIVGLHPGTVDSALSMPFQRAVPAGKLFTPDYSAQKLCEVINGLGAYDSGKCFAWDGAEIAP